MSRAARWSLAVLVAFALPRAGAPREAAAQSRTEVGLGALPATFSGLLPCADCVGTRYQINLLPRGAYMQRATSLLAGHDDSRYEVGAWSLSRGGRVLTLRSSREEISTWAVLGPKTLRKLDRSERPIDSKLPYELTRRASVDPMEPRVELSGMFRYVADAARLRDCCSGMDWPVAMTADYRALERAYVARRPAPGAELMVTLDVRIEPRPRMEGAGTEASLVVEKFVQAMPGETCNEGAAVTNGLGNTRWRPIRIVDRTVVVPQGQREPWIELDPRSMRVTGSGGCNRISGSYQSDERTLRFGPLATTKMACIDMEAETAFLRALERTRRYRVRGRTLDLFDAGGGLVARLEERNLR